MRDLHECRAEVFRRSNIRIAKRRKYRKRILACCVPLFVCIAVLCVAVLPVTRQVSKDSAPDRHEMLPGDSNAMGNGSYIQVEISAGDCSDQSQIITDIAQVTQILNTIQALYSSKENVPETGDDLTMETVPFQDYCDNVLGATSGNVSTITFTTEYADETVYTLAGNVLTSEATGQERILNDEQLAELHLVLGLTE